MPGRPDPAGAASPTIGPDAAAARGSRAARVPSRQRALGAFYTPPAVVEALLDRALEPALDEAERHGRLASFAVCDPSCGEGAFLGPAARRIAARLARSGLDPRAAADAVHGFDVDPDALARCAAVVAEAVGVAPRHLRLADALLDAPEDAYDAVLGNPPFLGQLTADTARTRARAAALRARWGPVARGYADTSAVFLVAAARMLRAGGRMALVQPQSVLAARDAGPARDALLDTARLTGFWWADTPLFEGTAVRVCALLARRGDPLTDAAARWTPTAPASEAAAPEATAAAPPALVERWHGAEFAARTSAAAPRTGTTWAALMTAGSVPTPPSPIAGTLSDRAAITADFRDAYYGLLPAVREEAEVRAALGVPADAPLSADRWVPVVTTGSIDPAILLRRPVRYGRRRFDAPVADLWTLDADMRAWAARRGVPKVLVATQSPRIEALADPLGALLPVTPVVTAACAAKDVWRVAAVLLGPPATAWGLTHCGGTALAAGTLKMSAAALRALPLPTEPEAWEQAARAVQSAHAAPDAAARARHLDAAAEAMCAAYTAADGYDPGAMLRWWKGRAR